MSRHRLQTPVSILLFRSLLLPLVRTLWHPRITGVVDALGDGPAFFYGNHCNRWDPFILNCFTPWSDPTGGVMTQEFFRKPFLRWAFLRLDIHPTRKRIAEPHLIRVLHRMIDEGRKIVIYPEGGSRWAGRPEPWMEATAKLFTRMGVPVYPVIYPEGGSRWAGRPEPWMEATAKLFTRMGVPVYPVITRGSYTSWPRWARYARPGRVEVEILEPMTFDRNEPFEDALRRLKEPIAFDENLPAEHLRPTRARRPADGIQRLLYRDPVTGDRDVLHTKDGTYVENTDGSLRLKMLPDSRLLDESTGEIHLTGDLYERIQAMPLTEGPDGVLLDNGVDAYTETEFPELRHHGPVGARLFRDRVELSGALNRTIPLDELLGVDTERNFKLQLFLQDEMVQLNFLGRGSALAWRDALRAVVPT